MITPLHFLKSAVAALVFARGQLHFQLACGLTALALSTGGAAAQTAPVRSVPIRGGSQPFAVTMGDDGNFWFTLSNSTNIARLTPRGMINYIRTPSLSNPAFITPGPDGNIWFGEGSTGKIASVTPTGVITEHQFSFFGVSVGITTGSDGNIWFTDQTDHAVWRFELSTGTFTEFPTPTPNSFPGDITTGSDGNMWFTEFAANAIGRITTAGAITIFPLSHAKSAPRGITNGPDGALWFVEQNNHYPLDGRRTKGPVPNYNYYGRIGRINPQTHQISEWTLPTPNTYPEGIVGRGNKLWFAETSGYVGEIDATSHVIHEYSVPVQASGPRDVALGSDDQLWFTQADGKRIGKVCPNRTDQQCSNGDL